MSCPSRGCPVLPPLPVYPLPVYVPLLFLPRHSRPSPHSLPFSTKCIDRHHHRVRGNVNFGFHFFISYIFFTYVVGVFVCDGVFVLGYRACACDWRWVDACAYRLSAVCFFLFPSLSVCILRTFSSSSWSLFSSFFMCVREGLHTMIILCARVNGGGRMSCCISSRHRSLLCSLRWHILHVLFLFLFSFFSFFFMRV